MLKTFLWLCGWYLLYVLHTMWLSSHLLHLVCKWRSSFTLHEYKTILCLIFTNYTLLLLHDRAWSFHISSKFTHAGLKFAQYMQTSKNYFWGEGSIVNLMSAILDLKWMIFHQVYVNHLMLKNLSQYWHQHENNIHFRFCCINKFEKCCSWLFHSQKLIFCSH